MQYNFTRDSVAVMLDQLSGNTFIGLTTETTPKLKGGKKNPLQGRITKRTVSVVQIFTNQNGSAYAKMVNRRLANEGKSEFTLSPRAWGERVEGTPFVTHKEKDYLEVIFHDVVSNEYFLDGKTPIDADDIEGLEKSREGNQGGLEDKVIIRTYALDSIREIRAFGNEYKAS